MLIIDPGRLPPHHLRERCGLGERHFGRQCALSLDWTNNGASAAVAIEGSDDRYNSERGLRLPAGFTSFANSRSGYIEVARGRNRIRRGAPVRQLSIAFSSGCDTEAADLRVVVSYRAAFLAEGSEN
jgi:hypothetical protein